MERIKKCQFRLWSCRLSHKRMCLQMKQTQQTTVEPSSVSHAWCQDFTPFYMRQYASSSHTTVCVIQLQLKDVAILGFHPFLWTVLLQGKHDYTTYIFTSVKTFLLHHLGTEVLHYSIHIVQCTNSSGSKQPQSMMHHHA